MRDRDCGRRHIVIARKDRRGRIGHIEQLFGRIEPGAIGEETLHDQRIILRQAKRGERVAIAGEAPLAGGLVRIADDEADPLMTEGSDMTGHLEGGTVIVDADRGEAWGGVAAGNRHRKG